MSTLLDAPTIEDVSGTDSLEFPTPAQFLDIQEIRERLFPLPVEAYVSTMEGTPTELLRGVVIKKVSKSPIHDYLSEEVRDILARQISPELFVVHERALKLSDSVPEPDVAVIRGRKSDYKKLYLTAAVLVVEIAVSSRSIDRAKALIYAEAGVSEYWIVVPEKRLVEVCRQPSPTGYGETLVVTAPAVLHSSALPGVSVDLAELFA